MFESDDFDNILSQLDYPEKLSESNNNHEMHQYGSLWNSSPVNSIIESSNDQVHFRMVTNKVNNLGSSSVSQLNYPENPSESKHNHELHHKDTQWNTCSPVNSIIELSNKQTVTNSIINVGSLSVEQNRTANIENIFDDYDKIEIDKEFEERNSQRCESLRHNKKRLLGSIFNHQSKRKFPGPAGLLSRTWSHCPDDDLSRIEISSQDVDYSREQLHPSVFELKLWFALQRDLQTWGLDRVDCIGDIKQQDMQSRKAHAIAAFVEAVDRSVGDHLIILRDSSGTINCTLHRDAWSALSEYITSENAALALWKPSVLTTGTTVKNHHLNITLNNIVAIYYSNYSNCQDDGKHFPSGYCKKVGSDYIAIKMVTCNQLMCDASVTTPAPQDKETESSNHLEGLDSLSFLEEIF